MWVEPSLNGQSDDGLIGPTVNYLADLSFRWKGRMPDLLARSNGVQGAHHNLTGPGAMGVFGKAVLQQFCVGQDDPELVVQEVEQFCQVTVGNSDLRVQSGHGEVQAVLRRS